MIAVDVELLLGTYRADPSGDAITDRARGEWPPAPSRLLASLIDAGGASGREAPELAAFAAAGPPVIYADPEPHRQSLHGRYVVRNTRAKGAHQEYLARKGSLVRPGERIVPRSRQIVFLYENFRPNSRIVSALQHRAARVGYLGCADSPVAMRINPVSMAPEGPAFVPDRNGSVLVNTHTERHVAAWCAAYDAWASDGINRRRFPALRHQTAYRPPGVGSDPEGNGGRVIAWMRFADTIPGRRVAAVAHAFKRAVYSRYQQLYGDIPPIWFHGHGFSKSEGDWQLARFLPLPNVGNRYADGRIHGAALWAPSGANDLETRQVGAAARAVTHLSEITGRLQLVAAGQTRRKRHPSWATHPDRWTKPSRQWATAFPVVSDRHGPMRLLGAADVGRWCTQAGLPQPVAARLSRTPLIPGGVDLAQPETARPGHRQTRPWTHVEVVFAQAIEGPVVIGAARSYGLGLFAPVEESVGKGSRR